MTKKRSRNFMILGIILAILAAAVAGALLFNVDGAVVSLHTVAEVVYQTAHQFGKRIVFVFFRWLFLREVVML